MQEVVYIFVLGNLCLVPVDVGERGDTATGEKNKEDYAWIYWRKLDGSWRVFGVKPSFCRKLFYEVF